MTISLRVTYKLLATAEANSDVLVCRTCASLAVSLLSLSAQCSAALTADSHAPVHNTDMI